ncbi:hypothetical protein ES319_D05G367600v1 [Gossypium barbadense]|uniref:Terpene synthase metal-binding domain-containing protein n=1 Tax=Gossypium barbadense TaxID=3634 RepID=A0A5J5RLY2_GOSBA|nr:hypothetical protein ES319_D05G367600v1 [Gossypium barbadense]
MKIYYHALYNSINEMAFDSLKEQGIDVIPFLKKLWTNLCKSYLLEAIWHYVGYTPTLQEYIDNAWISIVGSVMLAHSYLITDHIREKGLHNIQERYSDIIYRSSIIVRLANDLVTSLKKINENKMAKSPFSPMFIEIVINLARLSLLIYQNGDGLGIEGNKTKDIVLSLFVHPIFVPK